jgi:uncharacterized protein YceH (UPF0502 family)
MAITQRRSRLITIQELLDTQRESVPTRCSHCARDSHDRDHELVQASLRARIRALENRVVELEARLGGEP